MHNRKVKKWLGVFFGGGGSKVPLLGNAVHTMQSLVRQQILEPSCTAIRCQCFGYLFGSEEGILVYCAWGIFADMSPTNTILRGRLEQSVCKVQLFGLLAILEPHTLWGVIVA